jgi:hypothetical protein
VKTQIGQIAIAVAILLAAIIYASATRYQFFHYTDGVQTYERTFDCWTGRLR